MSEVLRARHKMVLEALAALNAQSLVQTECYFGGGTRIALELGEYRESADIDFLCASRAGYRTLRTSVNEHSLGMVAGRGLKLAREVIADRYGIRTFLDVNGEKLKLEIVLEGRIALSGGMEQGFSVPVLDGASCFAEKFLANADRWLDQSVLGRDVIDLAFMAAHWDRGTMRAGLDKASEAYGKVAAAAARQAATKMIEQAAWRKRCVSELDVTDTGTLLSGLKLVVAGSKARRGS